MFKSFIETMYDLLGQPRAVAHRSRKWFAEIPRKHPNFGRVTVRRRLAWDEKGNLVQTSEFVPHGPARATFVGDRSKYRPHQGKSECERRRRQAGRL